MFLLKQRQNYAVTLVEHGRKINKKQLDKHH